MSQNLSQSGRESVHDKNMQKLISILSCDCGGDFSTLENGVRCFKCGKEIKKTSNQGECLVFEEVYKLKDPSPKIFNPTTLRQNKLQNWREENYKIIRQWVEQLTDVNFLLDFGSGPLTNFELLKDNNTIFVDGAKFDGINIVCDFSNKTPFKSSSVDAILCSNVFEHLPEPQKTLREIARILRQDGCVLIFVPFVIKLHQEPYDFHRYTKHSLKYLADSSGLAVSEIREVGGFSNILGTIFSIAIRRTTHPIKRVGLKIQYLIWRILRKLYGDDPADEILPQGYAVFLTKKI